MPSFGGKAQQIEHEHDSPTPESGLRQNRATAGHAHRNGAKRGGRGDICSSPSSVRVAGRPSPSRSYWSHSKGRPSARAILPPGSRTVERNGVNEPNLPA
jgi:hypothetical protein